MIAIATVLLLLIKLLLFLAAALLALIILLLIVPVEYTLSADLKERTTAGAGARWALVKALVSFEDFTPRVGMSVFGREIRLRRAEKRLKDKAEKKKRKGRRPMPGMAFFREALSFLKEILDVLKPKEFYAEGYYGLDDPADTAALSALIMQLCSCMPNARLELCPVFDSELIDMHLRISGSVVPIMLVFIALKYLLKKDVRRVLIFREG